jgi:uncharacterized protein (TIRG00374 family)
MKDGPIAGLWRMVRAKTAAKVISLVVSVAILCVLYRKMDLVSIWEVLRTSSPVWLLISMGMIIPITIANALRFRWVSSGENKTSYIDALAMTVVSIAMNLFLPAKLGDLTKSHFLYESQQAPVGVAVSVIVFERLCDAFAISSWCLLAWLSGFGGEKLNPVVVPAIGIWGLSAGFLFTGQLASRLLTKLQSFRIFRGRKKLQSLAKGWPNLHRSLAGRGKWIVLFSIGLWLLHLTQIWMFTVAVRSNVPFAAGLALSPVVLLCGLVPFTLGGIGPRDAATIYLFAAYMAPESAAAVGLLMISRSILPSLAAIPFIGRYLDVILAQPPNLDRTTPEVDH